jgi:hypothetical protein
MSIPSEPDRVVDGLEHDALQLLLERASRHVLHSHACESCGALQCPCLVVPCPYRPFDRHAVTGEWYKCGFCALVAAEVTL